MKLFQSKATGGGSAARAAGLFRWLLLCGLSAVPLLAFTAPDTAAQGAAPGASERESSRRSPVLTLGEGDVVRLEVFGRPELSMTAPIAGDGSIPVPLAGEVKIAGQTASQAAQRIAASYRRQELLVDPQVTVFLVESSRQQVSVLGAVANPGLFALGRDGNVFDLLALAGGLAENGGGTVIVMRSDDNGKVTRHTVNLRGLGKQQLDGPAFRLRGGDSIFVPAADQFSIYGEVNQPNIYRLDPGMTVVEAISRGGGVTPRGSRNRIEIRRVNADGSFTTSSAALDDRVKPDDVIRIKGRIF